MRHRKRRLRPESSVSAFRVVLMLGLFIMTVSASHQDEVQMHSSAEENIFLAAAAAASPLHSKSNPITTDPDFFSEAVHFRSRRSTALNIEFVPPYLQPTSNSNNIIINNYNNTNSTNNTTNSTSNSTDSSSDFGNQTQPVANFTGDPIGVYQYDQVRVCP